MMHWFKILLIVVMVVSILAGFIKVGKGNYESTEKAWANFVGSILNGLVLWGIIVYL